MCLGIPGQITEIDGNEARVEFWNVEKTVRLDIVGDRVEEGDYILNHVGYALRKIPEEQVEETLELFESMLDHDRADMLTEDVMDELEAGGLQGATPGSEPSAGASSPDAEPDADETADETAGEDDDLLEELGIDV